MARSGSKPGKVYKYVHFEDVYIKTNLEGFYFGRFDYNTDKQITYYASLIHDALYQGLK